MNRPTLRQLDYLIAIAEHKSFSKAAQACHISQSSFSLGIQDLETAIGHPLIDRTRRQPALTKLGAEMVKDARGIMDYMEFMRERVKNMSEPMTGQLRFGVIPTIAPYLLPRIINEISNRYPKIEWQIDEDLTHRLLSKINDGKLDILLLALPYDTPELEQMHLFDEAFYYATPSFLPVEKTLTINDIEPDDLLLLKDGHCLRDHALNACNIQSPLIERAFSATSMPTLLHMVSAGFGATLIPEMAVKSGALPPNVTATSFETPRPCREIGLAWRKKSLLSKEYQELGKIIRRLA